MTGGEAIDPGSSEHAILMKLREDCPESAASYEQGIDDLKHERLSWRGTATEFRESLRELLDKLAPDENVRKSPGYKQEVGVSGPTMKQKVRFIIRGRQGSESQSRSFEDATEVIDDKLGGFVRSVYSRSSGSVHSACSKPEVESIKRFVDMVFVELLDVRTR
jgi:hypothetical protein